MRTVVAISGNKIGLVAGLKWAALADHKVGNRITTEIREKAEREDANKIVIFTVDAGGGALTSLGMYGENQYDADKVANLHSLAAAFVLSFPRDLHAILAWRIDEKRAAVVIVQDGLPIADEVKNIADAIKLIEDARSGKMGYSDHVIYTNDPNTFMRGELVSEAQLLAVQGKSTKLNRIPIRKIYVALIIMLIIGIISGWYYVNQSGKKEKWMKKMALVAASDPIPPYNALLSGSIGRLGLDRKSIVKTLDDLSHNRIWVSGWLLKNIDCTVGQCVFGWERDGGLTSELLAVYPGDEIMDKSTADLIFLVRKVELTDGGISNIAAAVPMSAAMKYYVNTYQLWRNAGLSVDLSGGADEFKVWPTPVAGDISRLPKEVTVKARPISVTAPLAVAKELIASTPEAVWWESFTVQHTLGDASKRLMISLNGKVYVK